MVAIGHHEGSQERGDSLPNIGESISKIVSNRAHLLRRLGITTIVGIPAMETVIFGSPEIIGILVATVIGGPCAREEMRQQFRRFRRSKFVEGISA